MEDSGSDWDSLPPQESLQKTNGHHSVDENPPYNFRDEIESNEMVPKRGEKVPGRDLPRKPNAYNMTRKLTDEQLNLKSIEQLKSLEKSQNSQGTPTSQVTIVENSNMNKSMSLMRPPLLRKQANEDQGSPNTNGIDNEGFDDISYSIREKPSNSSPSKENNNHFQNFPKSDERILLWQFEEPAESFLQTTEDKSGLKSEALASILVDKCDFLLSECFGFIKIPFMLVVLTLAHLVLFVLKALFKPFSDYMIKPLFVSMHNWVCVPVCGMSHHLCILFTHAISPFCRLMSILCCTKSRGHTQGDMSPI